MILISKFSILMAPCQSSAKYPRQDRPGKLNDLDIRNLLVLIVSLTITHWFPETIKVKVPYRTQNADCFSSKLPDKPRVNNFVSLQGLSTYETKEAISSAL